MAITLTAGFSVFGFVNTQAGVSESKYGQAVGATINYLQERLVVAQFVFSSGALTVYVYDNGNVNLQLAQIEIYDSTKTVVDVIYSSTSAVDQLHSGCGVSASAAETPVIGTGSGRFSATPAGQAQSIQLTLPNSAMNVNCPISPNWVSGTAYYAKVLAQYGNQVVYYQVR